jgi:hypothetical protein
MQPRTLEQALENRLWGAYLRIDRKNGGVGMAKLTRRGFIGTAAAAGALRGAGVTIAKPPMRRILTLAYDKSLGMMRAVERLVPR